MNTNTPTLLISNKPEDKASLQRAHLGVAKLEITNSCLTRSASILLSSRGFLDIGNLFSYSRFCEDVTQKVYRGNLVNTLSLVLFGIVATVWTGKAPLTAVQVVFLVGFDLVLSEAYYSFVNEELYSNENFGWLSQSFAGTLIISILLILFNLTSDSFVSTSIFFFILSTRLLRLI